MNSIGIKLKMMREFLGYSQNEISKITDVPQRSVSGYESTERVTGLLDYIFKICRLANKPVSEFFIEDILTMNETLPVYITGNDAALLKLIYENADLQTQIEIKKAFVQMARAILVSKSDRLKNLPEYRELFGDQG